ncbi:hypothetical protein A3J98_00605 [candidate division WS6 bacterium RIFOXYC1_FULL_33_10]|uniref:Uncharacterized protein n=1 Tax=candidate division WS6 bacterium RIFOXYC1_FULL_33_10 TaxID=1802606 RepID=A0A1F4UL81_9BACT|nr:MAG: hypothetical protein A3J98_00605 [candidate division WS6 bacterium RIFOXYC1_FULL_33_10]
MVYDYNESTGESEQNSIETINKCILDMFTEQTDSSNFFNGIVDDINVNDVDRYINALEINKNLPKELPALIENPTFKHIPIKDINIFAQMCDYSGIKFDEKLFQKKQKVYIIESTDYAISIIPIQLDEKFLSINISSLQDAPEFLMDMYNKKRKMELKDIKFVKLQPNNRQE